MPDSIIEILDRYPDTISRTIDLTFEKTSKTGETYAMGDPDPALTRYVPMNRYINARLAFRKIAQRKPTLAFIVGTDGEYPIKKEPIEFSLELVGSVKIARSRLLTEEDFDILREAELHLRANEQVVYDAFVRQFMQIPALLTASVTRLAYVLCLQLFSSATSTYIDPETNLGFELDYSAQVPAANTPLALTGTDLWSDAANARPLENLRDHLNAYYNQVYRFPEQIAMTATIADYMLNANDTKQKIAAMNGVFGVPAGNIASLPRPSIDDCLTWLRGEVTSAVTNSPLPEILVTDSFYYTVDNSGAEITRPFLSNNRYCFLLSNLVEAAFVPTATNDYRSSFATITELVSRAPKRERVSVDTKYLAACYDPRYLGWRQVIA